METPNPTDELFLGVDVGGNHVKMAFVDRQGALHNFQSFYTKEFKETGDFTQKLIQTIKFKLLDAQVPCSKIGVGFPGTLSKDRSMTLEIPAIPELNGQETGKRLREALPDCTIKLANDAKAAAIGEMYFGTGNLPDDYAFITLGTGVGSAYIQDRQIFLGADGNALELGHIPSRNELKLEQNIGKQGILNLGARRLDQFEGETRISRTKELSATEMVLAAGDGDVFSRAVFFEVGEILGEGLVSLIRILDVKYIVIGGGLGAAFDFILPGVNKTLYQYLSPYYLEPLRIVKATLGNDAGLLGAASLCF